MCTRKEDLKKRDLTLYHNEYLNCWLQCDADKFKWGDVYVNGEPKKLLLKLLGCGIVHGYENEDPTPAESYLIYDHITLNCEKKNFPKENPKYSKCYNCEYYEYKACPKITKEYFNEFDFYGILVGKTELHPSLLKFNNVINIKVKKLRKKAIKDEHGIYEFFKDHEGGNWIRYAADNYFAIKWIFTANSLKSIDERYVKDLFKLIGV